MADTTLGTGTDLSVLGVIILAVLVVLVASVAVIVRMARRRSPPPL